VLPLAVLQLLASFVISILAAFTAIVAGYHRLCGLCAMDRGCCCRRERAVAVVLSTTHFALPVAL